MADYAAQEDAHFVGGAWWQWKQSCGDPHSIGTPDGHPPERTDSLVRLQCPTNAPIGVPGAFATILSRAYPHAAPGRLTALSSDPAAGTLSVAGDTEGTGVLDVWVPGGGLPTPIVTGTNLSAVHVTAVDGGYRVTARASDSYRLELTR